MALQRFARWLYLRLGGQALFRVIPLCLALVCIGAGLSAIVTDLAVDWLYSTACLGVLTGWLLARTRLPGWGSGLAATGIGLTWLSLTIGQVGAYLSSLFSTFFPFLDQLLHRLPLDQAPVQEAWKSLLQSLAALTGRLTAWFSGVGAGKPTIDTLVDGLLWGLALWLAATWAAWWVRRRDAIAVGMVIPLGLLAYDIFYTNSAKGISWLGLAGGGWLLLQAIHSHLVARQHWQERRLDQAEIEPQLGASVGLLVAGLVLAGILLPAFSIKKLSDAIQQLYRIEPDKPLAESLGLHQTPQAGDAGSSGGSIGVGNIHTIGAGAHLSQDIVFLVSVDGYVPPPPTGEDYTTLTKPPPHYYWRAQTYEQYNGHGWTNQTGSLEEFAAGTSLQPEQPDSTSSYKFVTQHVTRVQQLDETLFVMGDLLQADQPVTAIWRSPGDLIGAQTQADAYTTESRLPYAREQKLHAAETDYPASIRSRYLSLPAELPQRVRDLALRLTAAQATPYDKAVAIQDYLRQFPYTLDVPAPPPERDAADYFLFDLQKGYCNYYATSMVVMARAAGIPARLVIGYTSGEYNYSESRFVIRQANAHAWVEIYFPGIGWVEFEPTAGQPRPVRPEETVEQNAVVTVPIPVAESKSESIPFDWARLQRPLLVIESILVTLLVLLLLAPATGKLAAVSASCQPGRDGHLPSSLSPGTCTGHENRSRPYTTRICQRTSLPAGSVGEEQTALAPARPAARSRLADRPVFPLPLRSAPTDESRRPPSGAHLVAASAQTAQDGKVTSVRHPEWYCTNECGSAQDISK